MSEYRRNFIPGATYFFTVVVHERRAILTTELGRACLRGAIQDEQAKRPFEILAFVLLPDHLHTIWTMPPEDSNFSMRWARIKSKFSRLYLYAGGRDGTLSASRVRHDECAIWQRRFWEHTCRDEDDLKHCTDYLHWNPVKHGLVKSVKEYPWSSFHRFVRAGEYHQDWGREVPFPAAIGSSWD